jgi:hypothetical protein
MQGVNGLRADTAILTPTSIRQRANETIWIEINA